MSLTSSELLSELRVIYTSIDDARFWLDEDYRYSILSKFKELIK